MSGESGSIARRRSPVSRPAVLPPPRTVILNLAGASGEACARDLRDLCRGRCVVDLAPLGRSVFFDLTAHVRPDDEVVLIAEDADTPVCSVVGRSASRVHLVLPRANSPR